MHFPTFTSVVLAASALLSVCHADNAAANPILKSRVARHIQEKREFKDFVISDVYVNTFETGTYTGINNKQLIFYWTDLNNKATTACTIQWHDPAASTITKPDGSKHPDTKPAGGDVNCAFSAKTDKFSWHFENYKNMNDFQLRLRHQFKKVNDPAFPPPYDTVTYWGTADVKLACREGDGQKGCYLPPGTKQLTAYVDSASA